MQCPWTISWLIGAPCWYLVISILVSLYHAYRGFMIQWIGAAQQNQQTPDNVRKWSKREILFVRCLEDMLFYFVCSLAGFVALLVANHLYESLDTSQPIDTGKSVLITFSFLVGIIGVSGQLSHIIQLGKIPKP